MFRLSKHKILTENSTEFHYQFLHRLQSYVVPPEIDPGAAEEEGEEGGQTGDLNNAFLVSFFLPIKDLAVIQATIHRR